MAFSEKFPSVPDASKTDLGELSDTNLSPQPYGVYSRGSVAYYAGARWPRSKRASPPLPTRTIPKSRGASAC